MAKYNLLNTLRLPEDLKGLTREQQSALCWEIRQQLIHTVSQNGGHLASNLGAVELTVALHTVLDLPEDEIVWDVGHQAYTHKMLSGRFSQFSTIRREGGLSGFPRPSESAYDAFIGGHASNSVSAACGIAKAKSLAGDQHHVVAVVGDGAFTGGMIYEALNNAGRSNDRLIIVLNDNDMSISKSVGSLARYLADKRTSERYIRLKGQVEDTLVKIPVVGEGVRDVMRHSKAVFRQALYHSNFFEDFGFDYLGPVDGHNIPALMRALAHAKELGKPVVLHVNTTKGKGYTFAEKNPAQYHGVSGFDRVSGRMKPAGENFSSVFGAELMRLAREDKCICAITAAMQAGTGLSEFAAEFLPQNRFFDVGIAEEHAVTFAGGLAAGGMLPVFAVYSTFLQRGYDQLIHDAVIDKRHIVLGVDRAGLVGDDGETHQGLFDAAFLSGIPGVTVFSPATFEDLRWSLGRALYGTEGPVAVRYPRGGEQTQAYLPENYQPGLYYHNVRGGEFLFVTYGRETAEVCAAMEQLDKTRRKADLLKLHQIAPLPADCIAAARRYRAVIFVEEGVRRGGIGEHFLAQLSEAGYRGRMRILAVDDPFIPQMPVASALKRCGLDAHSIVRAAEEFL